MAQRVDEGYIDIYPKINMARTRGAFAMLNNQVRRMAGGVQSTIGGMFAGVPQKAANVASGMRRLGGVLQKTGRGFTKFSQAIGIAAFQLQIMGYALTAFVSGPLLGLAAAAIKTGIQTAAGIEQAVLGLQSLVRNRPAVEKFTQSMITLAKKSPVLDVENVLRYSQSLVAAGLSLKETSQLMTAMGNIGQSLGLTTDQMNRALEALSQMASKGKVSMEELRRQLSNAGIPMKVVADGMGVTVQQLVKMVQEGIPASKVIKALIKVGSSKKFMEGAVRGATSFNAALQALKENIQVALATKFLDEHFRVKKEIVDGLVALQDALVDLIDNIDFSALISGFTRLVKKVGELVEKWKSLSDEDKDRILKLLAGLMLAGPAAIALGYLATSFSNLTAGIGALLQGAGILLKTLGAMGPAGLVLLGVILVVAALAGAVALFILKTKEGKQFWDGFVNTIRAGWEQYIKPALSELWKAITQQLIPALTNAINAIGFDNWKQFGEFVGKQLVFAIYGLIKVITFFVQMATWTVVMWTFAWHAIFKIITALRIAWNAVTSFISKIWRSVVAFIVNAALSIMAPWIGLVNRIRASWNSVSAFLKAAWNAVKNAVMAAIQGIRNFWTSMTAAIAARWKVITGAISSRWHAIINGIRGAAAQARDFMLAVFRNFRNNLAAVWGQVKKTAFSIWNAIVNFIKDKFGAAKRLAAGFRDGFLNIWNGIKNGMVAGANKIIDFLNSIIGKLNAVLPKNIGKISRFGGNISAKGQAALAQNVARKNRASGGFISGPGGPTDDKIPAWLSNGEYVLRAKAVKNLGVDMLNYINQKASLPNIPMFAAGGAIPKLVSLYRHMGGRGGVTSSYRPGDPGWHGRGLAVDFGGFNQDAVAGNLMRVGNKLLELIHSTKRANYGVKNGRLYNFGSKLWGEHKNHLHLAATVAGLNAIAGGAGGMPAKGKGGFAAFLTDLVSPILNKFKPGLDKIVDRFTPDSSIFRTFAHGVVDKFYDALTGKAQDLQGFSGTAVPAALAKWIQIAIKYAGVPASWIGPLKTLIMRESGGNPRAINNWDSNARRGDPSRGLMQTIGATFRRYRNKKLPNNIFDPIANIVAGINYIKARYGSIFRVQQAVGSTPRGYDNGGPLPPGGYAYNASRSTEMVLNKAQGKAFEQRIADTGDIILNARIFIGDREITDIVRVEVDKSNDNLVQRITAGKRR